MPLSNDDERRVRALAREEAANVIEARLPHIEQTLVTAVGARFKEALEPFRKQSETVEAMKLDIETIKHSVSSIPAQANIQTQQQTEILLRAMSAEATVKERERNDELALKRQTADVEITKVAVDKAVRNRTALLVFLGTVATALSALIAAAVMSSHH